ncbi:MAG: tRNA epoxyqueuosine(34) reductase QueG [Afipia sp.]
MDGGRSGLGALRGSRLLTTSPDAAALKAALVAEARAHGFSALGVTDPDSIEGARERLQTFLDAGAHGDMDWLANEPSRRASPKVLWSEVRSVIMLGMNYGPDENPLAMLEQTTRGNISVYARGDDYHDLIKKRLKVVARWLIAQAGGDVKVFVDTAAVMEKPLAHAAGLGWQGKHTNLVSREFGSWLFLGAIFTTLDLPRDDADVNHCGSCQACLDICPTDAFPAPYRLDARKCISYLTIEHKGAIPRELRTAIGNRIYGCDDCLSVCPWNKFAQEGHEAKLAARDELRAPKLADLSRLDDASFRALFTRSPVKRIGRDRFMRNVLIAIGNSGDLSLAPEARRLLEDPNPLVRGAAVWALSRLLSDQEFSELAAASNDNDESVRDEWAAGISASPSWPGLSRPSTP